MFIHSKLLLWHNAYTTFNKYQWPYCFSGVYVEIQRFPSSSSLNAKLIGSSLMLYIQWYHLTFNKKTSEHIFNIVCFNNKQKHSYLQWEGLWSCMAPRQICCHILWGRHAHWSLFINWRRYRRESEGFHKNYVTWTNWWMCMRGKKTHVHVHPSCTLWILIYGSLHALSSKQSGYLFFLWRSWKINYTFFNVVDLKTLLIICCKCKAKQVRNYVFNKQNTQ